MKNIQHPTSNTQHPVALRYDGHWLFDVGCWMLDVPKFILISAIRLYRLTISPAQVFLFGATGGCRFTPTCSVYAMDAVREHGALTGSALATKRICRCHPWGGGGYDPVPEKRQAKKAESGNISHPVHS
jgi:putative membrane protein insertion efficiency factor